MLLDFLAIILQTKGKVTLEQRSGSVRNEPPPGGLVFFTLDSPPPPSLLQSGKFTPANSSQQLLDTRGEYPDLIRGIRAELRAGELIARHHLVLSVRQMEHGSEEDNDRVDLFVSMIPEFKVSYVNVQVKADRSGVELFKRELGKRIDALYGPSELRGLQRRLERQRRERVVVINGGEKNTDEAIVSSFQAQLLGIAEFERRTFLRPFEVFRARAA